MNTRTTITIHLFGTFSMFKMPRPAYRVENLPEDSYQVSVYRSRSGVLELPEVYFSKSKDRVYQKTPSGYAVRFPNKLGRITLLGKDGKYHVVSLEVFKFAINEMMNDN